MDLKLASAPRRFIGFAVDAAMMAAVIAALLRAPWTSPSWLPVSVPLIYYGVLEVLLGWTPGRLITATRIVTDLGQRPTRSQLLARATLRFLPFEAALVLMGRPTAVHDLLSDTRVVRKTP